MYILIAHGNKEVKHDEEVYILQLDTLFCVDGEDLPST